MRGIRIFVAIFVVMFVALMVFNMPRVGQESAFPTFASTQIAAKPTSRPIWTTIVTTPTTAVPPTSCPTSATITQATTTQSTTIITTTKLTTTITTTEPAPTQPPYEEIPIWYPGQAPLVYTGKVVKLSPSERLWLAKLLHTEARNTNRMCLLYTCSSMLNFADYKGITSMEQLAHNSAYDGSKYVDSVEEENIKQEIFDVVDEVLNGHRIPKIVWFRTEHYHEYGKPNVGVPYSRPVVQVGPHYFSEVYYEWDIKW